MTGESWSPSEVAEHINRNINVTYMSFIPYPLSIEIIYFFFSFFLFCARREKWQNKIFVFIHVSIPLNWIQMENGVQLAVSTYEKPDLANKHKLLSSIMEIKFLKMKNVFKWLKCINGMVAVTRVKNTALNEWWMGRTTVRPHAIFIHLFTDCSSQYWIFGSTHRSSDGIKTKQKKNPFQCSASGEKLMDHFFCFFFCAVICFMQLRYE